MKTSSVHTIVAALLVLGITSFTGISYKPFKHSVSTENNNTFPTVLHNQETVASVKQEVILPSVQTTEMSAPAEPAVDLSYLRFNVADFIDPNENEITELPLADLNYLRFDVTQYMNESNEEITELPVPDYDYLRFDVNSFTEQNPVGFDEMPENDLMSMLRFNVADYINADTNNAGGIGELPVAE